jgi:protein-S-isoprenylcysteine O-methyltransferase Ste14
MNAFWLLVPLLAVRYGLMGLISRDALRRAAHFPPAVGGEKAALVVYQFTNIGLFVYLFFLQITVSGALFFIGLGVYGLGLAVTAVSVANFAGPGTSGINRNGLYRISRNPMYVGYFLSFLGCALLTRSAILFALLAVFQTASHWIILSEERWCMREFGDEYRRYMSEVRRYI